MSRYICFARWFKTNTPAKNIGLSVILVKEGPHAGIYADNLTVPVGAIGQSLTDAAEGQHTWEKICITSHVHLTPPELNDEDFTVHAWCFWRTTVNGSRGAVSS